MENSTALTLAFACSAVAIAAAVFALANAGGSMAKRRSTYAGDTKNILYWVQPILSTGVELTDRIGPVRIFIERLANSLRMRLLRAGQPGGVTPKEFVLLECLLGGLTLLVLIIWFGPSHLPIYLAAAGLTFYWPTLWLNERVKQQNVQIMGELPDALDLLALMIGAGLDLGQAITYYLRDARKTPLKVLLEEVRAQMVLGRTRSDALEYLARKVDIPALTQAVSAFVQGDKLGASVSETLATQATELREQRLQRAETHGQTASIKLLAPLMLFIMPCVGLIMFGPMLIEFFTK